MSRRCSHLKDIGLAKLIITKYPLTNGAPICNVEPVQKA
jgi:hypothetical protein